MKSRQYGAIRNKAIYLALAINLAGEKELLGMWLADTEGAKFWLSVFNEFKTRGMEDRFIARVVNTLLVLRNDHFATHGTGFAFQTMEIL